jgi:hypothetical protein
MLLSMLAPGAATLQQCCCLALLLACSKPPSQLYCERTCLLYW